ncbi:MAG: Mur ligase family protein, partial [Litorimonas sp.]
MTGWVFTALALAAFAVLAVTRSRTVLTYFQQEEYDGSRLFGVLREQRVFDILFSLSLIAAVGLAALGLPGWAAGLGLLAASLVIVRREHLYRYKKPLVMTDRATDIYRLSTALYLVSGGLALIHPLLLLVSVQLAPLATILANRAFAGRRERENAGYVRLGKAKLAECSPVTIGVTGSFGKTTTKYLLASALAASGPVFYSQGSINTVLGLTRHIRQRLQPSHRWFIAEMGAYGIGSIQRLCDFAEPGHGLITSIGAAHMERFGSLETISRAKSELAAFVLARGGYAVMPLALLEFEVFAELKAAHPDRLVSVGDTPDADMRVVDAQYTEAGWRVTLEDSRDDRAVAFTVPLIGDHNILNASLAMALTLLLAPASADDAVLNISVTEQVPHRLQKKDRGDGILVLDDAYNSNEAGFRSAVAELRRLADLRGGRAILVTPGLAEL